MIVDRRVLGGLGFHFPQGRILDTDDVEFLTALAQQCAQGVERARLYEAEMDVRQRRSGCRLLQRRSLRR